MSSREWARRSTTTGTGQPPTAAAEKKAERKQKESRKKAERKQKESRKKAERRGEGMLHGQVRLKLDFFTCANGTQEQVTTGDNR
jgi:hypothetical protein